MMTFITPDIFTNNHSFALYKLPGKSEIVGIKQKGEPMLLRTEDLTMNLSGYLIYPFQVNHQNPIQLIRPDELETFNLDQIAQLLEEKDNISNEGCIKETSTHFPSDKLDVRPSKCHYTCIKNEEERREIYKKLFERMHSKIQVKNSSLKKVVLSRQLEVKINDIHPDDYIDIYISACIKYPQNFVTLWYTPQSGMWLVATPECLLERVTSDLWRTMALAGTMTWDAGSPMGNKAYWSPKDKREQGIVAEYLHNTLQKFAEYIERSHTYPIKAGDLAHLRTDFTFSIKQDTSLGDLINDIHPTPAVCGLPKDEALNCIREVEGDVRRYYSGFSGPLNLNQNTRFYVSLRCVNLDIDKATLYAGGGLLRDSDEDVEWTETERKLQTILSLFSEDK